MSVDLPTAYSHTRMEIHIDVLYISIRSILDITQKFGTNYEVNMFGSNFIRFGSLSELNKNLMISGWIQISSGMIQIG